MLHKNQQARKVKSQPQLATECTPSLPRHNLRLRQQGVVLRQSRTKKAKHKELQRLTLNALVEVTRKNLQASIAVVRSKQPRLAPVSARCQGAV